MECFTREAPHFKQNRITVALLLNKKADKAMNILETISVQCPSCGEVMELQVDCEEGNQEITEECPVCDRLLTIVVTVSDNGVSSVEILAD